MGDHLKLENFFFNKFSDNDSTNEQGDLVLSIDQKEDYVHITINRLLFNSSNTKVELIPSLIYSILANSFIHETKNNSYYIPASSYAISYDLNSNLVHEINGTINSSKLIKK